MDPALIQHYLQHLGLRPAVLNGLDPGASRPWRVANVERGRCGLLGFDPDGTLVQRSARTGRHSLAVGDWVLLEDESVSPARVSQVLERLTCLKRGSAHREGEEQLIAANLDCVFIVAAFADTEKLEDRALRARRLDRFISAVADGGALPIVVLNKIDLAKRDAEELEAFRRELSVRLGGVEVLCASALTGGGLEGLSERVQPGDTIALIGPSGVGKSSLINALCGEVRQDVGHVRAADKKGRHTTTRRELLMLPSGALLIDTPGVREFAVVATDQVAGFDDIADLAATCRFSNCSHESEPGCAVRGAVEAGDLPGDRLASYRDLERDSQRLRAKHDAYARHQERSEDRRFGRMVRTAMAQKKSGRGS